MDRAQQIRNIEFETDASCVGEAMFGWAADTDRQQNGGEK
jgi:hypothetical protein